MINLFLNIMEYTWLLFIAFMAAYFLLFHLPPFCFCFKGNVICGLLFLQCQNIPVASSIVHIIITVHWGVLHCDWAMDC